LGRQYYAGPCWCQPDVREIRLTACVVLLRGSRWPHGRGPTGTKRPAKRTGFAGTAATLRRGSSTNRVPYVATLSIGPYLLLEGALPTTILYPKRRGSNNRSALRLGEPRGSLLTVCVVAEYHCARRPVRLPLSARGEMTARQMWPRPSAHKVVDRGQIFWAFVWPLLSKRTGVSPVLFVCALSREVRVRAKFGEAPPTHPSE
jgi:hypothetical protein